MKLLIINIFLFCLLNVQKVSAQEIPVIGTWEVDDYAYDISITCECTEMQQRAIKKGVMASVRNEFDLISFDTYFEFDEDNNVEGIVVEDEFETTYMQKDDVVTIDLGEDSIQLKLVPKEYERLMILEINEEKLEDSSRSFEMDEVGQVEFKFTLIKFIFKNLFDEPYDAYVDERYFEDD